MSLEDPSICAEEDISDLVGRHGLYMSLPHTSSGLTVVVFKMFA